IDRPLLTARLGPEVLPNKAKDRGAHVADFKAIVETFMSLQPLSTQLLNHSALLSSLVHRSHAFYKTTALELRRSGFMVARRGRGEVAVECGFVGAGALHVHPSPAVIRRGDDADKATTGAKASISATRSGSAEVDLNGKTRSGVEEDRGRNPAYNTLASASDVPPQPSIIVPGGDALGSIRLRVVPLGTTVQAQTSAFNLSGDGLGGGSVRDREIEVDGKGRRGMSAPVDSELASLLKEVDQRHKEWWDGEPGWWDGVVSAAQTPTVKTLVRAQRRLFTEDVLALVTAELRDAWSPHYTNAVVGKDNAEIEGVTAKIILGREPERQEGRAPEKAREKGDPDNMDRMEGMSYTVKSTSSPLTSPAVDPTWSRRSVLGEIKMASDVLDSYGENFSQDHGPGRRRERCVVVV
ncbi:hypothetical protein HDU93_003612, partial [Gonapodya sp. JEL0774]